MCVCVTRFELWAVNVRLWVGVLHSIVSQAYLSPVYVHGPGETALLQTGICTEPCWKYRAQSLAVGATPGSYFSDQKTFISIFEDFIRKHAIFHRQKWKCSQQQHIYFITPSTVHRFHRQKWKCSRQQHIYFIMPSTVHRPLLPIRYTRPANAPYLQSTYALRLGNLRLVRAG